MQKFRASRTQNTYKLPILYSARQRQLHKVIAITYILDLQPALLGFAAYVRNTRGAKEQYKIILLDLISSRPSTELSRCGISNADSLLKCFEILCVTSPLRIYILSMIVRSI